MCEILYFKHSIIKKVKNCTKMVFCIKQLIEKKCTLIQKGNKNPKVFDMVIISYLTSRNRNTEMRFQSCFTFSLLKRKHFLVKTIIKV